MKEIFKEIIQIATVKTSEDIIKYFSEAYEEEITGILILELRKTLENYKDELKKRAIAILLEQIKHIPGNESIVVEEVKTFLYENTEPEIERHTRDHENKKSKGDFGVVIAYPEVQRDPDAAYYGGNTVRINMARQGLIIQSKRKSSDKNKKEPSIPKSKEDAYDKIIKFYSFLLYNMSDKKQIKFEFVLPSSKETDSKSRILEALEKLLNEESEKLTFMNIVEDLFDKKIGTNNDNELEEILHSKKRNSIEFKLSYKGPPSFTPPTTPMQDSEQIRILA